LLAAALSGGPAARRATAEPSPPPATFPGDFLEGFPQPLVPQPLGEAARDRREAAALWAAGRAHYEREEFDQALRFYQRALRCDPQLHDLAQEIVLLAYHLGQDDVAARYAKLADPALDHPIVLEDLGLYVFRQGDTAEAAALLERALAVQEKIRDRFGVVLVHAELGWLYQLREQYPKAADHFARVIEALDHPGRWGLQEKDRNAILLRAGDFFGLTTVSDDKIRLTDDGVRRMYDVIGECFLRAHRPQDAAAAFRQGNALAPDTGVAEYNLARAAAEAGKPADALAHLEKALSLHVTNQGIDPYLLRAEVLKKLGREKELAPQRLETLYAAEGSNAALGRFLAGQYARAGKIDKAEALYLAVWKKDPTVAAYKELIDFCRKNQRADTLLAVLGDAMEKDGLLEALGPEEKAIVADAALCGRLVEAARQRLKRGPDKLDFGTRKAVAMLALEEKQYAVAAEFFDLAIAERPKEAANLLLLWGVELLMDERSAEAAKVLRRGLDLKPPAADLPAFYSYLAGALALGDRSDEALAAARKAAALRPNSLRFCSRLPWVLYRAKRYDEALAAYRSLLARFDGPPPARMQELLRNARSALGRRDWRLLAADALAAATLDDDRWPENRDILREARSELSGLCVLQERMPEAEEWLQQVLDEFPDDPGASNDLGYLWADQGVHLQRALKMIRLAVAAEPDNAAYRDSLGWIYYHTGRYAEAVAELQKAAAKEPAAEVLDHLGDAQLKAGHRDQAVDAWQRAARAFRKDKEEQKAKAVEKKIK
jgi:tetratricopeptide (TPR) repeat protein